MRPRALVRATALVLVFVFGIGMGLVGGYLALLSGGHP